jgi:hypothetical protein
MARLGRLSAETMAGSLSMEGENATLPAHHGGSRLS